jgi:hypothetical protein
VSSTVERTFVRSAATWTVEVNGAGSVETTAEHPFWVVDAGWVRVASLTVGDRLLEPDGSTLTVESVQATGRVETVFNFEVAGTHTYFTRVADGRWTLVHNDCGDDYVDLVGSDRAGHILDGERYPSGSIGGGHRPGTGIPGKTEFLAGMSDEEILHVISDVATDPAAVRRTQDAVTEIVEGTRGIMDIRVVIKNDVIWTGFPTNLPRNP